MFLQFSPTYHKPVPKKTKTETYDETSTVSLAPFSANPKIFFENVPIGRETTHILHINNPTDRPLTISVSHNFCDEINVNLSWIHCTIDENGAETLLITWTPTCEGSWRYTLHLTDGFRTKKDIPILFKTKQTSKQSKKKISGPTFNTRKKRSPVAAKLRKISPKKLSKSRMLKIEDKENYSNNIPLFENIDDRRSTYCVKIHKSAEIKEELEEPKFDDSLERISPIKSPSYLKPDSTPFASSSLFSPNRMTSPLFLTISHNSTPNTSTGTFVKGNISNETYLKENLSSETYVKPSLSPSLNARLASLTGIGAKSVIEANLWGEPLLRKNLQPIYENSFNSCVKKRKSETTFNVIPTKRANLNLVPKTLSTWSLQGRLPLRRLQKATLALQVNERDNLVLTTSDPFVLATTHNVDPFLTLALHSNEEWAKRQEENFMKWLNALLKPPSDMEAEEQVVDIAKLWKQCKTMEVPGAPSKEIVSKQFFHSNNRLNSLRRLAKNFYNSPKINDVLTNIYRIIETNRLTVRQDRDIHLDLFIKSELMSILFSYNTLWLRIGLETVYNTVISLNSNSDLVGITRFLNEYFFKNPTLARRHKSVHSSKYNVEIKKFMLKKFLSLIYFLDQAKTNKLIKHDPCLFAKNAPIKDSREALLKLARDCLVSVGDLVKFLRQFNYIVEHQQIYINEFDYAVKCLSADLRDGVRLTKVMEIIMMRDDLTKLLRVPAISRLQKVHNMKIVFSALNEAHFEIRNEIGPIDIVNGHKEKTLSFLWQIIHKFQAPLIVKHTTIIQQWWRSEKIQQKREILRRERQIKDDAARKIQKWYRNICLSLLLEEFIKYGRIYAQEMRENRAAMKIQCFMRMSVQKIKYRKMLSTILGLQHYARLKLLSMDYNKRIKAAIKIQSYFKMYLQRKEFMNLKKATIYIQNKYRANKLMIGEKRQFEVLKYTTIFIQRKFRANLIGKKERENYLKQRQSVILIQQKYRAYKLYRIEFERYTNMKFRAIQIQSWYRATKLMQVERNGFKALRWAAILIQQKYRALIAMRKQQEYYNKLKSSVISIQRRHRANRMCKMQSREYRRIREATVEIQCWYRMVTARRSYLELKKAAIQVQSRFRAQLLMRRQRREFEKLKKVVVFTQRQFRANQMCKNQSGQYRALKEVTIKIQSWYRMVITRRKYLELKKATILIQNRVRMRRLMLKQSENYEKLRSATIYIQRKFRANQMCKVQSKEYRTIREATTKIQSWYKMVVTRRHYLKLKNAAIVTQNRFRAQLLMRKQREDFEKLKKVVVYTQTQFRANQMCKNQSGQYRALKEVTIKIQSWYRMVITRRRYLELKKATILIQNRFRMRRLMLKQSENYEKLRSATIYIQGKFRANQMCKIQQAKYQNIQKSAIKLQSWFRMLQAKRNYLKLRQATITIQSRFRAQLLMKEQVDEYKKVRNVTIFVQRKFRANQLTKQTRKLYLELRSSTIYVQQQFRRKQLMVKQRKEFCELRQATIAIQNRFRAQLLMKKQMECYEQLKKVTVFVQNLYRANKKCKIQSEEYRRIREATIKIQSWFKMRKTRREYLEMRKASISIQRRFRAKLLMQREVENYKRIRSATVLVQRRFRTTQLARETRKWYINFKLTTIYVQKTFRNNQLARKQQKEYEKLREIVLSIQIRFKSKLLMKKIRKDFVELKNAAILVQRRIRANVLMRKQRIEYLKLLEEWKERRTQAATIIQKTVRGYLTRKVYGPMLTPEAIAERKLMKKRHEMAIKVQAFWRGYAVRSANKPEMKSICEKVKKATNEAKPEMTLGSRRDRALKLLANDDSRLTIVDITRAFEDLEFIIRRCKLTCGKLGKILPVHLFNTLTTTGRSLPEMELCIVGVNILLNLWRYQPTRQYTWQPQYLDHFFLLMLHWCDKDTPYFSSLCTLLWLLAHDENNKKTITSIKNFKVTLGKIEASCSRKYKMVLKVKKPIHTFFHNSFARLPLPSLEPDWGLEDERKPRIFLDSMQAIKSLMDILT